MKIEISKKIFPIIIFAIIAVAVLSVAAMRVTNLDIWWHLKAGELIWENGALLTEDPFSYTALGAPWVNHEWLFQILAWLAYDSLGSAALIAFKIIMTGGIALAVYKTIKLLLRSENAAMWGTLLLLCSIGVRVMARPFLLGLLFIAIFAYLLHSFRAGKERIIWWTIPITIVWVNWHGSGIIAPAMIFAYAFGESIQAKLSGPAAMERKSRRLLWLVGGSVLAASTINPMGIDTLLFPFEHANMTAIMAYTQEWMPILSPDLSNLIHIIILKGLIVITMISYIANRRDVRISHIALTALTSYTLLKGHRFAPYFAIINIPILLLNFRVWSKKLSIPVTRIALFRWLSITAAICAVAYTIMVGPPIALEGISLKCRKVGDAKFFAPRQMVKFLDENDIRGRVFNDMGYGGYLIFKRGPEEKVFIDGRTPIYGDDFYIKFVGALRSSVMFEKLDDEYDFDYLVFHSGTAWIYRKFHKYLWMNPKWSLVYMMGDGIVYLKNNKKNGDLIKRLELKNNPLMNMLKKSEEIERNKGIEKGSKT